MALPGLPLAIPGAANGALARRAPEDASTLHDGLGDRVPEQPRGSFAHALGQSGQLAHGVQGMGHAGLAQVDSHHDLRLVDVESRHAGTKDL